MLHRLFRGRLTFKLYVVVFIIVIISICGYLLPQLRLYTVTPGVVSISSSLHAPRHLSKIVTVVFRQFEDFENDIADSVQSFVSAFPNMPVMVICDKTPYPPFQFSATNETLRNVKIISLEFNVNASPESLNPLAKISTEFALFVPDSTRVLRRALQQASLAATLNPEHIIAIGVGTSNLVCQRIQWNYADWTLNYVKDGSGKICDAVIGPHALLIKTTLLHRLPQPFVLPFPEALYLQTSAKKVKVTVSFRFT